MVKLESHANPDPRMVWLLEQVNKAADTFVNAIADMEDEMMFKAFTIAKLSEAEQKPVCDIIMTQFAMRMKEVAPELIEEKTISAATQTDEDENFIIWFKATNEKPAAPEPIVIPPQPEPILKMEVVEEPVVAEGAEAAEVISLTTENEASS